MANVMQDALSQYLTGTRERAERTTEKAAQLASSLYVIPNALREAITNKMRANRDLIEQRSRAEAEYLATPAKARAEYIRPIESPEYLPPQQVEALVAQRKAQAYAPYASLSDLIGQRGLRTEDIIGQTTGMFQAQAAAAQGAAQIAQQTYQNLMQEYLAEAGLEAEERRFGLAERAQTFTERMGAEELGLQRAQLGEQQRQFGLTFGEQQKQFGLTFGAQEEQRRLDNTFQARQYADLITQQRWENDYRVARDRVGDERYAREYADQRADVNWNKVYQDKLYQLDQQASQLAQRQFEEIMLPAFQQVTLPMAQYELTKPYYAPSTQGSDLANQLASLKALGGGIAEKLFGIPGPATQPTPGARPTPAGATIYNPDWVVRDPSTGDVWEAESQQELQRYLGAGYIGFSPSPEVFNIAPQKKAVSKPVPGPVPVPTPTSWSNWFKKVAARR